MQGSRAARVQDSDAGFVELIRVKAMELRELLDEIELHVTEQYDHARATADLDEMQRLTDAAPFEWLKQAKLSLSAGLMFAKRAVEQPVTL